MVMEAPPSPQSVGREFVRQYYTLLNKAPMHLHRFYNHQSSFIHGGLDPPNRETSPVIGQKQIHQKIQQLNFRDCHAKITQVDSQATLGNGVVVQVTGELSNAGQPMRRFTQTFVLAAQSPKKYYVHNDIFRYQDEIISDEEGEPDAHSEEEEEIVINNQQVIPSDVQLSLSQPPAMTQYFNPTPPTQIQPSIPPPLHHSQQAPPHVLSAQPPVAAVNGAIHPEDVNVIPGPVPSHVQPATPQQPAIVNPMPNHQQGLVQPTLNKPPTPIEDPQASTYQDEPMEEPTENNYTENQEIVEPEQPISSEPASNEPKTYANLLKSSSNVIPYGNSPSQSVLSGPIPTNQPRSSSPIVGQNNQVFGSRVGNTANNNLNTRGNIAGGPGGARINQQQPARLPNRQDSVRNSVGGGSGGRNSINDDGGSWDDKRRSQGQNFNDVNQLFLGNLPHTATEDELRDIFSEFGIIVDLRVHSKPVNKVGGPPGARAPPNYGFITYETQEGVQTCLQRKPIFYPKGDKNGTVLNVEEKKVKERPSFGGSRPLTESNRGGRGDNGGPRRGGSGGLGNGGPSRISSGGPGGANGPNNRNNYNNRNSGPPNRGPNTYNRR